MYDARAYGSMIEDSARVESYSRALSQTIVPQSSVVLDIGTGTGIMASLACRHGARKVYAVEPDNIIILAREAALASGFAERIEFIQALSTSINLPEKIDVIVSDLHGVLPFFTQHIPTIADARDRFLKTDGHLIPRRDTLWVAPVDVPELYGDVVGPWEPNEFAEGSPTGRRIAVNTFRRARVRAEHLLASPNNCGTLEYGTIREPDFEAEVEMAISRTGTAHGHVMWFDSTLADDVSISNAPGPREHVYGRAFFPWTEPVSVKEGDTVILKLRATLQSEHYMWHWKTRILEHDRPDRPKANFNQSTFFGELLLPRRKAAASYVPELSEDGEVEAFVLAQMNGRNQQNEIADQLRRRFPARFPSLQDALTRVTATSGRYSR